MTKNKTTKNLEEAFSGDSRPNRKNFAFAKRADD